VKLLVDTSVLIDHLRGTRAATHRLSAAVRDGDELWSVTVVRTEVLAGMRPPEEGATRRLFDAVDWQPITIEIADRAGELARKFLRSHSGVDTIDYLIAAATEALGAELLTLNVKHFPMFPELRPAY
jgi:hypothetical protein